MLSQVLVGAWGALRWWRSPRHRPAGDLHPMLCAQSSRKIPDHQSDERLMHTSRGLRKRRATLDVRRIRFTKRSAVPYIAPPPRPQLSPRPSCATVTPLAMSSFHVLADPFRRAGAGCHMAAAAAGTPLESEELTPLPAPAGCAPIRLRPVGGWGRCGCPLSANSSVHSSTSGPIRGTCSGLNSFGVFFRPLLIPGMF